MRVLPHSLRASRNPKRLHRAGLRCPGEFAKARTGPARPSKPAGTLSVSPERGSVVRASSQKEELPAADKEHGRQGFERRSGRAVDSKLHGSGGARAARMRFRTELGDHNSGIQGICRGNRARRRRARSGKKGLIIDGAAIGVVRRNRGRKPQRDLTLSARAGTAQLVVEGDYLAVWPRGRLGNDSNRAFGRNRER